MALHPWRILSLCAGVGGLDLGVRLAEPEARSVCYVEREAAAASILVARMEDGWLHPAPIWSDLATFDAGAWRGAVDCCVSDDPCQPNSVAGRGFGDADERWLAGRSSTLCEPRGLVVSFARTSQGTRTDSSASSLPYWKRWAIALRHEYSARPKSALLIGARDFSFSQTWLTPNSEQFGADNPEAWLTRRAATKERLGNGNGFGLTLNMAVHLWPTPAGSEPRQGYQRRPAGMASQQNQQSLTTKAMDFQCSPSAPATPAGPTSLPERRTLNPLFVEWLMGWPIGWTGSAPVETASSPWWQAMRGELSRLVSRRPAQGTLL